MTIVIDASTTLAWQFDDEENEQALGALHYVKELGAWVPIIWRYEVANAIEMAIRRKRINEAFRTAAVDDLKNLPIETDVAGLNHVWSRTTELACRHALTIYDASYLELALRRQVPLATLDRRLADAARASAARLFGDAG